MDNLVKIHVSGIKEGYKKTLILFSYKGTRENLFVYIFYNIELLKINGCKSFHS